ncbi:hypothetical protein GW17_00035527 [Ensete ventricosum]|nr:hypothetical protein GW17_00035527 [Ensete ventricosum]
MEAVAIDEGEETKVGEVGGRGERELDHYIIRTMGGSIRENEVEGCGDENDKEEEGPGDYCVSSVGVVDAHPPEAGLEAPKLNTSTGEATCI